MNLKMILLLLGIVSPLLAIDIYIQVRNYRECRHHFSAIYCWTGHK